MSKRVQTLVGHLLVPNETSASSSPSQASAGSGAQNGYRYTFATDFSVLTKEQRDQYERDGFIVARGLVPEAQIDKYIARFRHLLAHPEERAPDMTVVRDVALAKAGMKKEQANTEETVTKFQDFVNDEGLFEYCQDENIINIVEAIVGKGSGIQAMHTMLINKPPDTGKGTSVHPVHQDLWYFTFRPADRIVAAWCAMEKITTENGCLFVVPGSHKTELLKHGYPAFDVNKAYHSILGIDPHLPVVSVPMEKGDVVFFHPLLWHGSGPNNSKTTRKAISCHFASSDCVYLDVKGTIQEEIEEEVKVMAKSKLFKTDAGFQGADMNLDLSDMWNLRSRVVRGSKSIEKLQPGQKSPGL